MLTPSPAQHPHQEVPRLMQRPGLAARNASFPPDGATIHRRGGGDFLSSAPGGAPEARRQHFPYRRWRSCLLADRAPSRSQAQAGEAIGMSLSHTADTSTGSPAGGRKGALGRAQGRAGFDSRAPHEVNHEAQL